MEDSDTMGCKSGGGEGIECEPTELSDLPEGCIAKVLSFTTPMDAVQLRAVSKIFKSAADSDHVWERFLPPDHATFISEPLLPCLPKKEVYFMACRDAVLSEDGKKCLWLDKATGKKCYMLSARTLRIAWVHDARHWRWISHPGARFAEVAELRSACWVEIRGTINTCMLSPKTLYAAYLVLKFRLYPFAYEDFIGIRARASVGLVGSESRQEILYLDFGGQQDHGRHTILRGDGWSEVKLGEFFNCGDTDVELEMTFLETESRQWKSHLLLQGIEIRPKHPY